MPLDCKAKEYVLSQLKKGIEGLQKFDFSPLSRSVGRLVSISEIFPDEVWSKELCLTALVIAGTGSSIEGDFKGADKEKKHQYIETYSKHLGLVYSAIEEEDTSKLDNYLKELVKVFFRELT